MGIERDLAEKWQTKWGQVNYPFLTKRGTKRTSVKNMPAQQLPFL